MVTAARRAIHGGPLLPRSARLATNAPSIDAAARARRGMGRGPQRPPVSALPVVGVVLDREDRPRCAATPVALSAQRQAAVPVTARRPSPVVPFPSPRCPGPPSTRARGRSPLRSPSHDGRAGRRHAAIHARQHRARVHAKLPVLRAGGNSPRAAPGARLPGGRIARTRSAPAVRSHLNTSWLRRTLSSARTVRASPRLYAPSPSVSVPSRPRWAVPET